MIGEDRACDACLARAGLLEALAPLIEVVATKPPNAGVRGLLTLDDDELARALAPGGSEGLRRALDRSPPPAEVLARQRPSEAWSTCRHSSDYPKVLNDLAGQVPVALFGRGDRSRLGTLGERPAVALVGARRASSYGREVGRDLARQLSRAGAAVISGLANGVDAAAHEGALAGAGLTVAVLGCGVDRAYPRRQVGLYERIVEEGLVLSELPCGARPWRWTFPARNRIMAALSMMTVVVEAAERSGSLITAEMAADLQRDVGAVPRACQRTGSRRRESAPGGRRVRGAQR